MAFWALIPAIMSAVGMVATAQSQQGQMPMTGGGGAADKASEDNKLSEVERLGRDSKDATEPDPTYNTGDIKFGESYQSDTSQSVSYTGLEQAMRANLDYLKQLDSSPQSSNAGLQRDASIPVSPAQQMILNKLNLGKGEIAQSTLNTLKAEKSQPIPQNKGGYNWSGLGLQVASMALGAASQQGQPPQVGGGFALPALSNQQQSESYKLNLIGGNSAVNESSVQRLQSSRQRKDLGGNNYA